MGVVTTFILCTTSTTPQVALFHRCATMPTFPNHWAAVSGTIEEGETPYQAACVGMINDDETEVGKVHLGVVHIFDVEKPLVKAREDDISEAGFESLGNIHSDLKSYETWSQICFSALFQEKSFTA